jgi:HAD superfamily hydrolase (TIGR01509 family)
MSIQALLFDFDGLILDTETPEYEVLKSIYQSYGLDFPLSEWAKVIGASPGIFDPFAHLAQSTTQPVDPDALKKEFLKRSLEAIDQQPPLPGVLKLLDAAEQRGLRLAVASSSPTVWVHGHLKRLGLFERFQSILTRDDVAFPKPAPDLYLKTLEFFNLQPHQAIVFEDSPNGITAGRAAGIFTVAVPNPVTRLLDTSHASLNVSSLAELSLDELIARANHR